jgi:hypothetical protein
LDNLEQSPLAVARPAAAISSSQSSMGYEDFFKQRLIEAT